jgi:hypothetical protein
MGAGVFYFDDLLGILLMTKRSEGVRRIVQLISVLCASGWVLVILIGTDLFRRMTTDQLIISAIGLAITYYFPQVICKATYWIIDGFKIDKETSQDNNTNLTN